MKSFCSLWRHRVIVFVVFLVFPWIQGWCAETWFAIPSPKSHGEVRFDYRCPARTNVATGVLLLVPGYNGSGKQMLNAAWSRFADECGLILLAPTFKTTAEEIRNRQGYYYPEAWSGAVVEQALSDLAKKERVNADKILIFGFSAGAHFAHRFALWNPKRVKAFVASSAGWWDPPSRQLANVPALIMCGEKDERFGATRTFMEEGLRLDLPLIWRSYHGVGHEITSAMQRMAEVFLRHYAANTEDEPVAGDLQTYRFVPMKEANTIPSAVRIILPSRAIAEIWSKEK